MQNLWKTLPKPFTVLAPMEDVTDVVFREIMTMLPRPDVFFTEFTNADGLSSRGHDRVVQKLTYTENQRPIVAQIWGMNPETMRKAAEEVKELGFDGIDINMGCPVPAVIKRGAGAGHIGNYEQTKEIIDAVKEGAGEMPVSVKTRLGQTTIIADEWIPFLLKQNLAALTIHGRIAAQMSKGDADWNMIGNAVTMRNEHAPETVLVGNGDIMSYAQVVEKHEAHKVDGVMIGRGVFSNPWIFEKTLTPATHTKQEYIDILLKHIALFDDTWGKNKNFELMKKFFKMYVKDFDDASLMRQQLMECKTRTQIEDTVRNLLQSTYGPTGGTVSET